MLRSRFHSKRARWIGAIAVAAGLNQCTPLSDWLAAEPPKHAWATLTDLPDGFQMQTWNGVLFFRFKVSDLIDLDGRPIESFSEAQRRGFVADVREVCKKLGSLDRLSAASFDSGAMRQFQDVRFSVPFETHLIYPQGGTPGDPAADNSPDGSVKRVLIFSRQEGTRSAYFYRTAPGVYRIGEINVAVPEAASDAPYGAASGLPVARRVAGEFFPTALASDSLDLERVWFPNNVSGEGKVFFWRIKGSAAPYFVGSDGLAYRAKQGYTLLPGSLLRPRPAGETMLEPLKAREADPLAPSLVPDAAEAAAIVEQLGDVRTGAPGLPWGATEEQVGAAFPGMIPVALTDLDRLVRESRRGGLLRWAWEPLHYGVVLRVAESSQGFVSFNGDRFAGVVQEISEREYEAFQVGIPAKIAAAPAPGDGPISYPGGGGPIPGAWRIGNTAVYLFPYEWQDGVVYGLLLQDWNTPSRFNPPATPPEGRN